MTNRVLLIKHVTGRLLFDAAKQGCAFALTAERDGWRLTVENVPAPDADVIKRLASELNLFYFEQNAEEPIRKWWLYDSDCPKLDYSGNGTLVLKVDRKVRYTNEDPGQTSFETPEA